MDGVLKHDQVEAKPRRSKRRKPKKRGHEKIGGGGKCTQINPDNPDLGHRCRGFSVAKNGKPDVFFGSRHRVAALWLHGEFARF